MRLDRPCVVRLDFETGPNTTLGIHDHDAGRSEGTKEKEIHGRGSYKLQVKRGKVGDNRPGANFGRLNVAEILDLGRM